MSKTIKIEYFGFEGQGGTVKEAKQDAGSKIDALHSGTWQPVVVSWRGESVLIYRTINGWQSSFLQHNGEPLKVSTGWQSYGENADLKEIIRSAQYHIAQLGWKIEDPTDLFPDFINTDEVKRDLIHYREWQLAYRKFRAEGHSDNDAHRLASESQWTRSA